MTLTVHVITLLCLSSALSQNQEIRYCAPSAKTKAFAVVRHDGLSFNLDYVGNAKAAELMRKIGKKSRLTVVVTGVEISGHTIKVDSALAPSADTNS